MAFWFLAPLAISAISSLVGAKKASDASKQAAATQNASAQQAMAYQQQMYGQAQNLYAPYLARGQQTSATLGRLMAPPAGSRYAAPPPPPAQGLMPFSQLGQIPPSFGVNQAGQRPPVMPPQYYGG